MNIGWFICMCLWAICMLLWGYLGLKKKEWVKAAIAASIGVLFALMSLVFLHI